MKCRFSLLFACAVLCLLLLGSCGAERTRYVIGVSQCSDDAWRSQMNQEIRREALFYPQARVEFRSAHDDSRRQIADIEAFIREGVNLIVVAPNEADAMAPVIEKAYRQGIPVVLMDRKINSEQYTAYIGADNYRMGREVGAYIAHSLGGRGNVVELTGLQGSTPARDRHRGLLDALKAYPDIHIVATADAGWFRQSAAQAFDSILRREPRIDLVFAHNDPMAAGARQAAARVGRDTTMKFIGVDALSGEGLGVEMVTAGTLDATFIYPTGGDWVMQVAMDILEGRNYPRETLLPTAVVNRQNARIMQLQTDHIATLDKKIEQLDGQLNSFLMRMATQRTFLLVSVGMLVLVMGLLVYVVRSVRRHGRPLSELFRQQRQAEQQRDRVVARAGQQADAARARQDFDYHVSCDIRTPLGLIAEPVSQLADSPRLDAHDRDLLDMAHRNVTLLQRLVNQLIDFRRYEDGRLALNLSRFDLRTALLRWTDAFRALSFRSHIHLHVQAAPDTDSMVVADSEKLERVVYNLLSNAFRLTAENGSISVALTFDGEGAERSLCLQVSDTGVGMPAEYVQHIFDSVYSQADARYVTSRVELALVKAFVELHHGTVSMDSSLRQGSCFTIRMPACQTGLPVVPDDDCRRDVLPSLKEGAVLAAGQPVPAAVSAAADDAAGRPVVLVVDASPDVRRYVRLTLQGEYQVMEAANGQDALWRAMKYVPDVILCDAHMPVMSGMECCRRLKSELRTQHIPVVLLTDDAADDALKIEGYACGADSYLPKTFSSRLLAVRLHNLIDNRQRLQRFFADGSNASLQKVPAADVDSGFLNRLYAIIDKHLSDPDFGVEQLGERIGLSRVQLYRKTKTLCGYSPNELLRATRLKRAASLLASTEKTIAEITYEVGFSSPSYFTKCYKEFFGENPAHFLKRKNENTGL